MLILPTQGAHSTISSVGMIVL
ncbi:hypothetical protein EMIT0196MI5_20176 [Pseudomonas sp. IT-196MI5]